MQDMLAKKHTVLDYGASIYLNYLDLNGAVYFAFSEGIKSARIKLQSQDDFFKGARVERGTFGSLGLFKVLPRFLNSYFEDSKSKLSEIQADKELKDFSYQNKMRENNVVSGSLLREMFDELDDNLEILKRTNSQHVKFGNQVQFLHLETHKFLAFCPNKSSYVEPDNLAVELVDEFSDLTTFKLLPVFNYQANNKGLIMDSDEVYILSCAEQAKGSYQPYLSVSKSVCKLS